MSKIKAKHQPEHLKKTGQSVPVYPVQSVDKVLIRDKASQSFRRARRNKIKSVFSGTCASEMTLLMTAAAEQPSCKLLVDKALWALSTA
jgi:hypothetical protein